MISLICDEWFSLSLKLLFSLMWYMVLVVDIVLSSYVVYSFVAADDIALFSCGMWYMNSLS